MIGLNFVYEKRELLFSIDIVADINEKYTLDSFDFDNQSFDDYIDYLEFLGFDEYIFVTLEKPGRLSKVVTYLQQFLTVNFQIIELFELEKILSKSDCLLLNTELSKNRMYKEILSLDIEKVYENGYRAFNTEIYPIEFGKGLLKHVLVDDLEIFLSENASLLRYFTINSAIYLENAPKSSSINIPVIAKKKYEIEGNEYPKMSLEDLYNHIILFLKTGRLELCSNILDYGIIVGISKFNSLVFCKQEFYLDQRKTLKIGKSQDVYKKLVNEATQSGNIGKLEKVREEIKYLIPILIDINRIYGHLEFITPFNEYRLPRVCNDGIKLGWIAFKNEEVSFAFNIISKRLFKVNDFFIENFEYVIKNQDKKSENQSVNQVKELLKIYE